MAGWEKRATSRYKWCFEESEASEGAEDKVLLAFVIPPRLMAWSTFVLRKNALQTVHTNLSKQMEKLVKEKWSRHSERDCV